MIAPTIGRVVLFNDGLSDQRVPALITYVWSDWMINIGGFDRNGVSFSRTSVPLCQSEDETCEAGTAEWMPYQKEQAEKHDADQAQEESCKCDPALVSDAGQGTPK